MSASLLSSLAENAEKSIQSLQKDLLKVRTGRASAALIDHIQVDYYGAMSPLSNVASINTTDARTIVVKPFERKPRRVARALRADRLALRRARCLRGAVRSSVRTGCRPVPHALSSTGGR